MVIRRATIDVNLAHLKLDSGAPTLVCRRLWPASRTALHPAAYPTADRYRLLMFTINLTLITRTVVFILIL